MKKTFQQLINQFSAFTKILFTRKTVAIEKQYPKTNTENKAYLTMPITFDFIAYFDENELENDAEDISHENLEVVTTSEVFCMNNENYNEIPYSINSQWFECCIN